MGRSIFFNIARYREVPQLYYLIASISALMINRKLELMLVFQPPPSTGVAKYSSPSSAIM